MGNETEIEFKNLLTIEEYKRALAFIGKSTSDAIKQVNTYFDHPTVPLKQKKQAFRLRQKADHCELTFKEAISTTVSNETNVTISENEASIILSQGYVNTRDYPEFLHLPERLDCVGSLETHRLEVEFHGGLLVLDHSIYGQTEDFEVEYETTNELEGQVIFDSFLQDVNIPARPTDKKIARFYNEMKRMAERT
ncbi:CYTH domain-containing protein [Paenisporosarcina cavernae]|nr:CYTH domain-containing protein [Paenisporosarcina cavernae]